MFDRLNLPPFDICLRRQSDGSIQVYDPLRCKWLMLTPEEWVRQHFVNYMLTRLAFPQPLLANEVSLTLNSTSRRCDTVAFTRDLRPLLIVEYKRSSVAITKAVFDQIARYNSVLGARYLIVSNGMHHYCCQFDGSSYSFLNTIPSYNEMLDSVNN
ncbi:MAG: type I restriction enzyme HsdR N-terminal domain-containing protein [Muribaculaceae bacterium]|nr:type I restriction enzyme HsdR N-terminal domain-containing protein [Muribaculaceae bacterium]